MSPDVRRARWWLGVAIALALGCRAYVGILTSDDAYITFRYARHLAQYGQPVYNLGERVLGTSTPLFMLVLAAAARVHLPLGATAFVLSNIADAVSLAVVWQLLIRAGEPFASRIAVVLLAVVPVFLTSVASGMEAPLYTALVLGSMCALPPVPGSAMPAGVLLGLTAICRPEGAIAAGAALAALGLERRWSMAFRVVLAACLTSVPWFWFAIVYYGSPLPQSVVAKAAGQAHVLDGLRTFAALLGSTRYLPITAFAAIGAVRLWPRGTAWRALILWWLVYAAAFTLTGAFARAEWYFTPLLPVYFGCAAAGLSGVLNTRLLVRWRVPIAALFTTGFVVVSAAHLPDHRRVLQHARAIREQTYIRVAARIASSSAPCDVAASEIGAIGDAFDGRIIDLAGLVTPSAVGATHADVMRRLNAQWLIAQNIYIPDDLLRDAWFTALFRKVQTIDLEPGRTTEVYERRDANCAPRGIPRS